MNTSLELTAHRVSLVVPLYNEAESVAPLLARVHEVLAGYRHPWELILVSDGSTDDTERVMRQGIAQYGGHVRSITLQRNFGQTAAMQAGIDAARGDVIVTLDGDLQNDPADIPRMVQRLLDEDLDLLVGWRKDRKDSLWLRTIPSRIANWLIGRMTEVRLHDYGCSLKVYRAQVIKNVRLYGEMHRFIPAWMAAHTATSRIKEEVVAHSPRQFGVSKYGLSRTFRVIMDLLSVYFFIRFRARPGHYFGGIALAFGVIGFIGMSYLFILKIFFGENIGTRPLLMISVLLIVMAVQFLTTGVLSELIARTYFESGQARSYIMRNPESPEESAEAGWKHSA
ncbi:MAG: glycosyltransferase family 2 protein [Gammaproteobacteria bacterium]|nr:glycosyltransferase family 2 protein [Gammaproteobacteria bacterium]